MVQVWKMDSVTSHSAGNNWGLSPAGGESRGTRGDVHSSAAEEDLINSPKPGVPRGPCAVPAGLRNPYDFVLVEQELPGSGISSSSGNGRTDNGILDSESSGQSPELSAGSVTDSTNPKQSTLVEFDVVRKGRLRVVPQSHKTLLPDWSACTYRETDALFSDSATLSGIPGTPIPSPDSLSEDGDPKTITTGSSQSPPSALNPDIQPLGPMEPGPATSVELGHPSGQASPSRKIPLSYPFEFRPGSLPTSLEPDGNRNPPFPGPEISGRPSIGPQFPIPSPRLTIPPPQTPIVFGMDGMSPKDVPVSSSQTPILSGTDGRSPVHTELPSSPSLVLFGTDRKDTRDVGVSSSSTLQHHSGRAVKRLGFVEPQDSSPISIPGSPTSVGGDRSPWSLF